jgi:hypothetical protein
LSVCKHFGALAHLPCASADRKPCSSLGDIESLVPAEKRIWFLKRKLGPPDPPLPPGAGGELASWADRASWERYDRTQATSTARTQPPLCKPHISRPGFIKPHTRVTYHAYGTINIVRITFFANPLQATRQGSLKHKTLNPKP